MAYVPPRPANGTNFNVISVDDDFVAHDRRSVATTIKMIQLSTGERQQQQQRNATQAETDENDELLLRLRKGRVPCTTSCTRQTLPRHARDARDARGCLVLVYVIVHEMEVEVVVHGMDVVALWYGFVH